MFMFVFSLLILTADDFDKNSFKCGSINCILAFEISLIIYCLFCFFSKGYSFYLFVFLSLELLIHLLGTSFVCYLLSIVSVAPILVPVLFYKFPCLGDISSLLLSIILMVFTAFYVAFFLFFWRALDTSDYAYTTVADFGTILICNWILSWRQNF